MSDTSPTPPRSPAVRTPWLQTLRVYLEPASLRMLTLGFSAGLPLLLVLGTLSFRLREAGIDRSTIGYLSWVGLAYGFKWLWAPLVDRMPLPLLTRWLGRRRGWLLFAQMLIVAGLCGMAFNDPRVSLTPLVWYSVLCVPVYALGWFCVGKRFLLYTAYGTLCTTLCSFVITFTIPIESEVYATVVGGVGFMLYDDPTHLATVVSRYQRLKNELAEAERKLAAARRTASTWIIHPLPMPASALTSGLMRTRPSTSEMRRCSLAANARSCVTTTKAVPSMALSSHIRL